jgi:LPXTG-motif cell wall-anchored protein
MKLRAWLVGLVLVAGVPAPAAVPLERACAAEAEGPHAALVVDTGAKVLGYCVALPAKGASGLDLIRLAARQHGLSYKFGYGGQAVCMLAGLGSEDEDCFERGEPYWGYWHGTPSGEWTWSSVGARSFTVEEGDVEGWSFGTGTTGSSHPQPRTEASLEAVCGASDPHPTPGGDDGDGDDGGPKQEPKEDNGHDNDDGAPSKERNRPPPPAPSAAPAPPASPLAAPTPDSSDAAQPVGSTPQDSNGAGDRERTRAKGATAAPTPEPSPSLEVVAPGDLRAVGDDDDSGAPAAGLVGLGVALIMAGGGLLVSRRRRRSHPA